ncbi:PAS domain-containing protein, partial [Paracraurococcus ruber]|nr:hypothetical protein [Paracraurococcus ruber]
MSGGCRGGPAVARPGLLRLWPRRPGLPEAFALLAEAASEGMALLDAGGRLLAANPALARLAGPAPG